MLFLAVVVVVVVVVVFVGFVLRSDESLAESDCHVRSVILYACCFFDLLTVLIVNAGQKRRQGGRLYLFSL